MNGVDRRVPAISHRGICQRPRLESCRFVSLYTAPRFGNDSSASRGPRTSPCERGSRDARSDSADSGCGEGGRAKRGGRGARQRQGALDSSHDQRGMPEGSPTVRRTRRERVRRSRKKTPLHGAAELTAIVVVDGHADVGGRAFDMRDTDGRSRFGACVCQRCQQRCDGLQPDDQTPHDTHAKAASLRRTIGVRAFLPRPTGVTRH